MHQPRTLNHTLQFRKPPTTSTFRPEKWEADLVAFLDASDTGDIADRRRQAQKFADKLDAVRDSVRPPHYARFSDHISRPLMTETFVSDNGNNIRSLCGSCVASFAFSHPHLRLHQSPSNAKPCLSHQVASQEYTTERSKVGLLQSKPPRLTTWQISRSCQR